MPVAMRVLEARYWDGRYPRPGETIEVDEAYVGALEQARFAERLPATPDPPRRGRPPAREGKHGPS